MVGCLQLCISPLAYFLGPWQSVWKAKLRLKASELMQHEKLRPKRAARCQKAATWHVPMPTSLAMFFRQTFLFCHGLRTRLELEKAYPWYLLQ